MQYDVHFLDIFANYDWVDKFGREGDKNSIYNLNKGKSTVIITGCGCAPGITSLMAKKLGQKFKSIETIEAGFCWDSNMKEFVPPFCISDAAYELFYDARVIIAKQDKVIEPRSYSKEYNFPLIGKQTVYAMSHIELYSLLDYFENKGIQNVFFYGGFPKHCIKILESFNSLGLIQDKEGVLSIPDANGNVQTYTKQEIVTAISKHIPTPKNYTETEIVWCTITGVNELDEITTQTMVCQVPPIPGWEEHGCNVDTGIPAAVVSEMILHNKVPPGVYIPETIVDPDLFIQELEKFGFEFIIQKDPNNLSNI
jgi:saccharopine dehydrogenase-like NADP-dependent oxidoreductase